MTGFHSKNKSRKSLRAKTNHHFSRTYLVVVEIITKRKQQFKRTTLNPQSQRCINGCSNQLDDDFSSLHRKYANEEIHQTSRNHPLEKDGRTGISGVPGRQGFKVWAVTGDPVSAARLRQATVMSWRLGPSQDSGAEARVFSIWISRWVVELISIDGWFSCSKTTDSAISRARLTGLSSVQVKNKLRFEFVRFWITGCVAKTYFLICKNQWLAWTQQNRLRDFVVQQNTDSDSWMSLPTQKLDVSITSNLKT